MWKLIRLVVLAVALLAVSPPSTGASGVNAPCTAAGDAYQIGCRLLPGHADGWYSHVSASPEPAVSSTRISDHYR